MAKISGPDFITILVGDLEASYRFYKERLACASHPKNNLMHVRSPPSRAETAGTGSSALDR
jgi:catechol 2,3-dioxygenase-like lactoylglutathione lyase family enzyme